MEVGQGIDYELEREINEFEEAKAGVKGLADTGIVKLPRIFYNSPKNPESPSFSNGALPKLEVPVIDLSSNYHEVIKQVLEASEKWGFFQIVNHGIPLGILEEILDATRQFHEQPTDIKKNFYTEDFQQKVRLISNTFLRTTKHGDWRDSLICDYYDGVLDPQIIPLLYRKAVSNYMEQLLKVKEKISQVLSEALGLDNSYLSRIECMGSANLQGHYYPPCPEPELTMGITNHSDPFYLTILLQDSVGGFQVLHQNQWVDVKPLTGALVVSIGDLMQIITNDKLKSAEHRVLLVGKKGPRISVGCSFYPSTKIMFQPYGPIQELLNLENKEAIYKEVSLVDYMAYYTGKGFDGNPTLPHFKN